MMEIISPEMILYLLIFIGAGIIIYLLIKWYKKHVENKNAAELSETSISTTYLPPPANPAKGIRAVEKFETLQKWADEINEGIHYFGDDDVYTILSVYKRAKTKNDLARLNSILQIRGIDPIKVFSKGLSRDQNSKLMEWEKNLPEYYKK